MSPGAWGVVLDADVLLRSSARDLFLYLATLGTVDPVWSSQILDEVARNFPSGPERFEGLRGAVENAFPRARKSGFEHRIDTIVRTSKEDRHVLALAAEYEADLISFNHQDYDHAEARLLGVEVCSPDEALMRLVEQDSASVEQAVRRAYLMLRRPPVGWADYVEHVGADGLPKTADWITTLWEPRR